MSLGHLRMGPGHCGHPALFWGQISRRRVWMLGNEERPGTERWCPSLAAVSLPCKSSLVVWVTGWEIRMVLTSLAMIQNSLLSLLTLYPTSSPFPFSPFFLFLPVFLSVLFPLSFAYLFSIFSLFIACLLSALFFFLLFPSFLVLFPIPLFSSLAFLPFLPWCRCH